MGLETATYIHQLDPSNPVGASDPKGQGDDHFRLIKATLQNTLPNVEGEVSASHTELNRLVGLTRDLSVINDLSAFAINSFAPTLTAVANVSGLVDEGHHYIRIGNLVFVMGNVLFNAGGAGSTAFALSLPIASDFTDANQAFGCGTAVGATIAALALVSDSTNNRVQLTHVAGGVAGTNANYLFAYRIL